MSDSAHTLFISDLHLTADRPDISQQFLSFIQDSAPRAEALYILGDLFEIWLGDDAMTPTHGIILNAIKSISDRGISVYFMRGNRDFLIGDEFAKACGCEILNDPSVINLYGTPTLLTHGDLLCTDDTDYQAFRAYIRDPKTIKQLMALSIEERIAKGREYRAGSQAANKEKPMDIMDVNQDAVLAMLREHNVEHMIMGHTHRPNEHSFELEGKPAHRIVLGDWHEQGSQVYADASGCELQELVRRV